MKKWNLNVNLLRCIFDICGRGMTAALEEADIAYSTWRDWMECEKEGAQKKATSGVMVLPLVRLCNVLCIPVTRLFYEEGEMVVIPARQDLVIPSSKFVPVHFDLPRFRSSFGIRSAAKKQVVAMLEELGYTTIVHQRWIRENSTLRVGHLIHVCNTYGYDLLSYFDDRNPPMELDALASVPEEELSLEERLSRTEKEKALTESDKAMLLRDNELLRRKLKQAEKDIFQLKTEKSELAYEVVRLKQYIEQMEKGFPGMVAES